MSRTEEFLVNKNRIMGFDIGLKGGFCTEIGNGRLFLGEYTGLKNLVKVLRILKPMIVVAENVHTMPKQGVVSNGTLMEQKGHLSGACAALDIPIEHIEPTRWMACVTLKKTKHFKDKKQWKKHLVEVAEGLAGDRASRGTINEKTADAFLIWYYYSSIKTDKPLKPIAINT